jgi:hypothetical protein
MQTDAPVRLDKGFNWTVAETCDGVTYQLIEVSGSHREDRVGSRPYRSALARLLLRFVS